MKKRIGILTYHRSINYGAFLQAYALYQTVKKIFGKYALVEIIDYESKRAYEIYRNTYYDTRHELYSAFHKCLFKINRSRPYIRTDSLTDITDYLQRHKYDLIIVGSDEVWKINGMRGFPNAYWLHDICDIHRAAYGVSSRNTETDICDNKKQYIREALRTYEYIGVRDRITKDMIECVCNVKVNMNCDPVFLFDFKLDKKYKEKLYTKNNLDRRKKNFLVMLPDNRLVQLIKRRFGKEYNIISVYDRNSYADLNLINIDPFEWIDVINSADFFVTNRFHGTCFAMKCNTSFIALDTYDNQKTSKIYDMLQRCNMDIAYWPYQGYQSDEKRNNVLNYIEQYLDVSYDFFEKIEYLKKDSDNFFAYLNGVKYDV